jgi:outer membrane protein assembly factor BamB
LLCAQPGLVSALDPADGSVLWRHTVTADDASSAPPVGSGGLVHVLTDTGRLLQALDPDSGEVRWEKDLSAYGSTRFAGGTLLLTAADGTVTGVDGATGDTKWSHPIPGQREAYFTSFDGDRSAYVATVTGEGSGARTRVTAVDPETGDVRWDVRLEGGLKPVGSHDGALTLLSAGGAFGNTATVVRYDPRTEKTDRVSLPVALPQARAAVRGDIVYLLADGGSLAAVDMAAGKQLWRIETGVLRGSAPVADARHVYFTAVDGRLVAVDAGTGKLVGETPPRLGTSELVTPSLPEPVLVEDGRVCSGAPDGTVFGVDGGRPAGW